MNKIERNISKFLNTILRKNFEKKFSKRILEKKIARFSKGILRNFQFKTIRKIFIRKNVFKTLWKTFLDFLNVLIFQE